MSNLTRREVEAMRGTAEGKTNADIAADMGITTDTAKNYISSALEKTGCEDRNQLGLYVHAVDRACNALRRVSNE